jgi:hypothetical protein
LKHQHLRFATYKHHLDYYYGCFTFLTALFHSYAMARTKQTGVKSAGMRVPRKELASKKRSASEDDDVSRRSTKKSKAGEDEDEDKILVPKLLKDDAGDSYIPVPHLPVPPYVYLNADMRYSSNRTVCAAARSMNSKDRP